MRANFPLQHQVDKASLVTVCKPKQLEKRVEVKDDWSGLAICGANAWRLVVT
jgi:hypothetical protein